MRTNIDIDDKLMKQAMKAFGVGTKKAAVDAALRRLVELRREEAERKQQNRGRQGSHAESQEDDWLDRWLAKDRKAIFNDR